MHRFHSWYQRRGDNVTLLLVIAFQLVAVGVTTGLIVWLFN